MICYAKEGRERTWNEAAEVVKVELYGNKSAEEAVESWERGDGATGSVTVVRDEEGRWCATEVLRLLSSDSMSDLGPRS
jgi:hypothetical protein